MNLRVNESPYRTNVMITDRCILQRVSATNGFVNKKKSSLATDGAAATCVTEMADKNKHGERVIRVLFVYRLAVRKSGLPPASTVTLFTFFSDCKRFSDHRIRAVLPNTVIPIPIDMTVAKVWIFFRHFLEPSMTDPIF